MGRNSRDPGVVIVDERCCGPLLCRTSRAFSSGSSARDISTISWTILSRRLFGVAYHGDGNRRRVGEDESHLLKLAAAPPVLRQRHPAPCQWAEKHGHGRSATRHPAPVSPSPWAKITVAVCFFTAGTTRAAGPDIGAAGCRRTPVFLLPWGCLTVEMYPFLWHSVSALARFL